MNKHSKVIGADPTPIVNEMVAVALARGDLVVAAAHHGSRFERHYKRGRDVLFSTTDSRSARLDLFRDIRQASDVDAIALSLVPELSSTNGGVPSKEARTHELARTFIADTMKRLWEQGNAYKQQADGSVSPFQTTAMLLRFLNPKSREKLQTLLQGTESERFLDTADGEEALALASSETRWLKVLDEAKGPSISIGDWVSRYGGKQGGALFIHNPIRPSGAYPRMVPALMRLAMLGTLERERRGENRPVWFVNDKFDETAPIQGMPDMLTRLPEAGGRVVLGISSIEKLRDLYGKTDATAIAGQSDNTLIAGGSKRLDKSTAEYASGLVSFPKRGSILPEPIRSRLDRLSAYTTKMTKRFGYPSSMADRIAALPVNRGYLKTSSGPWRKVKLSADSIAAAMGEKPDVMAHQPVEPVGRTEGAGSSVSAKQNPPNSLINAAVSEPLMRRHMLQNYRRYRANFSEARRQTRDNAGRPAGDNER